MPSSSSFIRNSDFFLQESRHRNLRYLNDQYGHGFQAMLVQLMKQVELNISPSEVSNLVNSSENSDGSSRSVFTDRTARRIEQALDLPMCCLDVPNWHFRNNLEYFWQYAAYAATDRAWFDGLFHRLLEVPAHQPVSPHMNTNASDFVTKIDWTAVRARLREKQAEIAQN